MILIFSLFMAVHMKITFLSNGNLKSENWNWTWFFSSLFLGVHFIVNIVSWLELSGSTMDSPWKELTSPWDLKLTFSFIEDKIVVLSHIVKMSSGLSQSHINVNYDGTRYWRVKRPNHLSRKLSLAIFLITLFIRCDNKYLQPLPSSNIVSNHCWRSKAVN